MTIRELNNMHRVLTLLYNEIDFLAEEDVEELKSTIEQEIHAKRVQAFKDHVDSMFGVEDEKLERFYNATWCIEFMGHCVELDNVADVYSAMQDLLAQYIEDYL